MATNSLVHALKFALALSNHALLLKLLPNKEERRE